MGPEPSGNSKLSLLFIAEPGVPAHRLQKIRANLDARIVQVYGVSPDLYDSSEALGINPEGSLDMQVIADISHKFPHTTAVVCLTEMPRHSGKHPLIAEVNTSNCLAVISCPTLEGPCPRRRLAQTIMACLARMDLPTNPGTTPATRLAWGTWGKNEHGFSMRARVFTGELRTITGMVVTNEPLHTAPRLSSVLATAAATGAFGIFYNSIWQMSSTLSTGRLVFVAVMAIALMVLWLMYNNRLWDRPVSKNRAWLITLYNVSTVVTLLLCVIMLFAALLVFTLVGGLVIISPEFMEQILGYEVGFTDYLRIAWLSASMGVIGGGLGSSFDSEEDIRRVTHGQRERQRITEPEETDEGSA